MAVDVVVVNFHTDSLLHDFINSYRKHRFEGCELFVVDVENLLKGLLDPVVRARINTDTNVGFGNACNRGATLGENDVILLANADTLLSADLEDCYNQLVAHDNWGVLGPRQVDETNAITAAGMLGGARNPHPRGWHELDEGQYSDIFEDGPMVAGSLYFIKRSLWYDLTDCPMFQAVQPDSLGAFLETPHYFEDTWCSYHARAHGFKTVYYGPAKMTHLWHKASRHGGWADNQFVTSQAMMRDACSAHEIVCE